MPKRISYISAALIPNSVRTLLSPNRGPNFSFVKLFLNISTFSFQAFSKRWLFLSCPVTKSAHIESLGSGGSGRAV